MTEVRTEADSPAWCYDKAGIQGACEEHSGTTLVVASTWTSSGDMRSGPGATIWNQPCSWYWSVANRMQAITMSSASRLLKPCMILHVFLFSSPLPSHRISSPSLSFSPPPHFLLAHQPDEENPSEDSMVPGYGQGTRRKEPRFLDGSVSKADAAKTLSPIPIKPLLFGCCH